MSIRLQFLHKFMHSFHFQIGLFCIMSIRLPFLHNVNKLPFSNCFFFLLFFCKMSIRFLLLVPLDLLSAAWAKVKASHNWTLWSCTNRDCSSGLLQNFSLCLCTIVTNMNSKLILENHWTVPPQKPTSRLQPLSLSSHHSYPHSAQNVKLQVWLDQGFPKLKMLLNCTPPFLHH